MKTRAVVLLLCLGVFLAYPQASSAQWVQTSGPEGCHVTALAAGGGNLYSVVEGHGFFMSSDNGARWRVVKTGFPPEQEFACLAWSNGTLFAGSKQGLVLFSRDDGAVATGGADGLVRLFDAGSGKPIGEFSGHTGDVYDVAFAPDGA
ncbi:MAG: hypothetical protein NTX99_04220, partial [Candidatus Aminicenantes bacterium]|nr:hypothetical protein [Candidatus Aminicenantes bacterium]